MKVNVPISQAGNRLAEDNGHGQDAQELDLFPGL